MKRWATLCSLHASAKSKSERGERGREGEGTRKRMKDISTYHYIDKANKFREANWGGEVTHA